MSSPDRLILPGYDSLAYAAAFISKLALQRPIPLEEINSNHQKKGQSGTTVLPEKILSCDQ